MPNLTIKNAARQMLETLTRGRSQLETQRLDIEWKLEEIDDEIYRLITLISAYDEIERRAHGTAALSHEPPEYDSSANPTTENVTLTESIKQMVLMHPGKAVDIAGHLGKSARSIKNYLTILANRGEIAHWPECHMWGPIEWTPPTNEGISNA